MLNVVLSDASEDDAGLSVSLPQSLVDCVLTRAFSQPSSPEDLLHKALQDSCIFGVLLVYWGWQCNASCEGSLRRYSRTNKTLEAMLLNHPSLFKSEAVHPRGTESVLTTSFVHGCGLTT